MARTTKDPKGGPVSIRFTEGLLGRLKEAAQEGGRPLTAEITRRLEDSFTEEARRVEALGGHQTYAFLLLVGQALRILEDEVGQRWHWDPFTFSHAQDAIAEILYYFRPRGRRVVPKQTAHFERLRVAGAREEGAWVSPKTYPFGFYAGRLAIGHLFFEDYHRRHPEAPRAPTPTPREPYRPDERRQRGIVYAPPDARLSQQLALDLRPLFSNAGRGWADSPFTKWQRKHRRKGGRRG